MHWREPKGRVMAYRKVEGDLLALLQDVGVEARLLAGLQLVRQGRCRDARCQEAHEGNCREK